MDPPRGNSSLHFIISQEQWAAITAPGEQTGVDILLRDITACRMWELGFKPPTFLLEDEHTDIQKTQKTLVICTEPETTVQYRER